MVLSSILILSSSNFPYLTRLIGNMYLDYLLGILILSIPFLLFVNSFLIKPLILKIISFLFFGILSFISLSILLLILVLKPLIFYPGYDGRTEEEIFKNNRSEFHELLQLAKEDKLLHGECGVQYAFPEKFKHLVSKTPSTNPHCIYLNEDPFILSFAVNDFYSPIVYMEDENRFADKFYDIDGFDLKKEVKLEDHWYTSTRDWN